MTMEVVDGAKQANIFTTRTEGRCTGVESSIETVEECVEAEGVLGLSDGKGPANNIANKTKNTIGITNLSHVFLIVSVMTLRPPVCFCNEINLTATRIRISCFPIGRCSNFVVHR